MKLERKKIHKICEKGHEWLTNDINDSCYDCYKQKEHDRKREQVDAFLEKFPNCGILANQIYPHNSSPLYGLLKEIETNLQPKNKKVTK